jgi:hypothetical protein
MSKVFSAHAVSVDGYISGRTPGSDEEFGRGLGDAPMLFDLRAGRQPGPGDNPYLDTIRLSHDTGFAPTFDVATAVADYVAWRADNPC